MSHNLSDFTYPFSDDLIAATPVTPRDHSKLMLINRTTGDISHHHFFDLPKFIDKNCVLVRNNTKVIKAKVMAKKPTGGKLEILFIKPVKNDENSCGWETLIKPGIKINQLINLDDQLTATCTQINDYVRLLSIPTSLTSFWQWLEQNGQIPLPPYIAKQPNVQTGDHENYQTVYAANLGSVASPTAGLHFTPKLELELKNKGVEIIDVTLHVGLGTFLPVKTQNITQHQMHEEWFEITSAASDQLNQAIKQNKKIIAVGTTSTRVLESAVEVNQITGQKSFSPQTNTTKLYVYPPYQFKIVSGLITNFHLPENTLLMLVSAFATQPNSPQEFTTFMNSIMGKAYQAAIANGYRFFSFGDSSLII